MSNQPVSPIQWLPRLSDVWHVDYLLLPDGRVLPLHFSKKL